MPIGALVTMKAKPGSEAELMQRVTDVIADVRAEPGNLMAVVLRDREDPAKVHLFEIYRDEAAIAEHKAYAHTREKSPALQALFGEPMVSRLFETIDWPGTQKLPA